MAGIMHKIEERFKGGNKEGEKHDEYKGEGHAQLVRPGHGYGEHKPGYGYGEHRPQKKEGFADQIKGKVHGEGGKEKKKKKGGKGKKHGYDHGGSSSSSDSD